MVLMNTNILFKAFLITCIQLVIQSTPRAQFVTVASNSESTNKIYNRPSSLGIIGDTSDVKTRTTAGIALIGGGKDVDEAFKWLIKKSGGGNVVILRATGTNAYNNYIFNLDKISSVETLKIDSRELANNDTVIRIIRNAEMLFISGGDQSNYMKYWRGTRTADAINYLINKKKIPVGGTSAGCAILGQMYYSGEGASATSAEVLANPYHKNVTVYKNDFLKARNLKNVITDQHYVARSRQGRHVVFLSRIITDWNIYAKGIAADERTAVCIDAKGNATVIGTSKAYFIKSMRNRKPEVCEKGKPLQWAAHNKALLVYEIIGTPQGNGKFSVRNFKSRKASGGKWFWWWVDTGTFQQSAM